MSLSIAFHYIALNISQIWQNEPGVDLKAKNYVSWGFLVLEDIA